MRVAILGAGVVGVTGAWYLARAGHEVIAVNPNAQTFEGEPCYPDVKSIPGGVDAVMIITRPETTERIVRDCHDAGIRRVWMHCSLGTSPLKLTKKLADSITSVSAEAVRLCQENNIAVIPGGCPMMFCEPVDFGHKCMRGTLRLIGSLRSEQKGLETFG